MPYPRQDEPAFVALSRFVVTNGMEEAVKTAFRARPHRVDDAPGFLRMDVLSPADRDEELWLLTYWTDRQSFEAWHHGHSYHEAHLGIPAGLKLNPAETQLRFFAHVTS